MLIFGIDVPLIELILAFVIVLFLVLVEAIIIISLLVKQLSKTKKLGDLIEKLSGTLLEIKKKEIEELDKLKRK